MVTTTLELTVDNLVLIRTLATADTVTKATVAKATATVTPMHSHTAMVRRMKPLQPLLIKTLGEKLAMCEKNKL